MCHFVGLRASRLTPPQAAEAWYAMSERVESMWNMDVPKFLDLLVAIRSATILGKRKA